MARIPKPREGSPLVVRKRPLPFSYFPVGRGARRYGLFDAVFATSPWAVMQGAVSEQLRSVPQRDEALAFLEQSSDFYASASTRMAANPLLYYYAFLNLAKPLLRVLGFTRSLDRAVHGLSETHSGPGADPRDSQVVVQSARGGRVNLFVELCDRLGMPRPAAGDTYPVLDLLGQVVIGHRLWREATNGAERFLSLEDVQIRHDAPAREVWLRLLVERDDLDRYGITHKRVLQEGALEPGFREVKGGDVPHGLVCFEQTRPASYTGRPTDVVMSLVGTARPLLWRIVTVGPGSSYRKYYLHLSPPSAVRLPQLASLWVLLFYFGSVVRYRPHLFNAMSRGKYGAFVAEFVAAQPEQLLYLLASEMARREVARPAIV